MRSMRVQSNDPAYIRVQSILKKRASPKSGDGGVFIANLICMAVIGVGWYFSPNWGYYWALTLTSVSLRFSISNYILILAKGVETAEENQVLREWELHEKLNQLLDRSET